MRRAYVTALVAAGLAVVHLSGQGRPNFSGTWTLVSSVPDNTWAMGKRFVASQDATSLLIEIPEAVQQIRLESNSGGGTTSTSLAPPQQLREVYWLDGSEVTRTFPDAPAAPRPGAIMTGGTEESVSTVTWQDQQLVIVTKNVLKSIWWNRGGDVVRTHQTVRNALRLEADGTLVVDHQITVDRVPGRGEPAGGGRPAPVRSVYQRTVGR